MTSIADQFQAEFYHGWASTFDSYWNGTQILKYPQDLMVYQEIIVECKPDIIIETGTCNGGSAGFYADIMSLYGGGKVITLDVEPSFRTNDHKDVEYIIADSGDPKVAEGILRYSVGHPKIMVVLDSDHRKDHVLKELEIWSRFVTPGQYLVVEDSNLNGHPLMPDHIAPGEWGPGPWEAIDEWLPNHPEFVIDKTREKYLMTANPNGWLKRV